MIILSDAIASIQANRSIYFCTTTRLVAGLVEEALILGCQNVSACVRDGRWVVMASDDWLEQSGVPVRVVFERILPLVQAGPNSMWTEVLLTAFCDQVATWSQKDALVVNGDPTQWPQVWGEMRHAFPVMQRFVAFSAPK